MSNDNSYNRGTLSTILVAVTFLLVVILFILFAFRPEIKRSMYRSNTLQQSSDIETNIKYYLDNRDYSGFSNYICRENIKMEYGTDLYAYMYIKYASDHYMYLLNSLTNMYLDSSFHYYDYMSNSIASYIRGIYRYASDENIPNGYGEQLIEDVNMIIKTYLKMSDEEIASIETMSDAEFTYFMEQKMEVLINERK